MFLRGLIECRVYLIIWLLFGVCVVFFYLSLMWVFWCLMVRICGRNFTLIYAITWSCWAVRSFLLSSLVSTSFYIYHFYLVISHWNLDCCNSYCPNFEISEWNGPYAGKGPFSIFTFPPIPRFGMHSSDFSKRSTKRAYNNPSCFDRKLTTHLLTASTSAYQV